MSQYYILNEKLEPVAVTLEHFIEYAAKNGDPARQVKLDFVDGVKISTIFLNVDLTFFRSPDSLPLLFETFVFGGRHHGLSRRYITWDAAVAGHTEILDLVVKNEFKAID